MNTIEDRVAKLKVSYPASSYIYLKGGEGETIQQSWMMTVKIWLVGVWKVKILK